MWKEFREFALRGNVIDIAIGMLVGGAFNPIARSLVDQCGAPGAHHPELPGMSFADSAPRPALRPLHDARGEPLKRCAHERARRAGGRESPSMVREGRGRG